MNRFLKEALLFQAALRDPQVPVYIKLLLFLLIAYVLSPVDIIPDFIPIVGLLDEAILIPVALVLIKRLIPGEVLIRLENQVQQEKPPKYLLISGIILVCLLWLAIVMLFVRLLIV